MISLRSRERTSPHSSDGLPPAAALAQRDVSLMYHEPDCEHNRCSDEEVARCRGLEEHAHSPGEEKTGGNTVDKNCPRPHGLPPAIGQGVESHVRRVGGAGSTDRQFKSPATFPTRYSS